MSHNPTSSESSIPLTALLRGSGIIVVGMGLRLVLIFITEVSAARILMPERYGLITWGLFLANILCMLSSFGLNTAVRRFLPIYQINNNKGSVRGIVQFSTALSLAGGVCCGFLLFYLSGWLANEVIGDSRQAAILLIFVILLPLWNLEKLFLAVFNGFKQPTYKVFVEDIFVSAGFLSVVIWAWAINGREVEIAQGYVLVHFLAVSFALILIFKKTPYGLSRSSPPIYDISGWLSFSLPLMLTEVLGKSTVGIIDVLVVGAMTASYQVGIYRCASDMAVVMSVVLMCFAFMYFPMASEFFEKKAKEEWRDMNGRIARWCMILSFPIFATLFFFPDEVIHTLYGPDYLDAAIVLKILSIAYFGHTIVGFTAMNLVIAGLTGLQLLAYITSFLINIFGNILLIPIYGLKGAAIASLISLWTVNGISLIFMKMKLNLTPFSLFYFRTLVMLVLMAFLFSSIMEYDIYFSGTTRIFLFMALCLFSMILLYLHGGLTDEMDIDVFRSILRPAR